MQEVRQLLQTATAKVTNDKIVIELTRPDEQFGDYSTNVAMQLSKKLDQPPTGGPRAIAEQIIAAIEPNKVISQTSVAGPGFINITLSDTALLELAHTAPAQVLKDKVVVAEYSDPNPFKVLHAGHLYTTITGDAIASLLEAAGAKVHRLNYGGDVGLHVGKSMWGIIQKLGGENPGKLAEVPGDKRPEWISERYVEGNTAYEDDPATKRQIIETNKRVYQLHSEHDTTSAFAQIYWTCRQWSYDGFDALYKQLQIDPFERYIPESEVTPKGIELVEQGLAKKVFESSEGAVVFKGEEHGLHTRVFMNSEGLPTYEAKDLGLAATKWQKYHFDLNVIITGNDIVEYMKVVLKALSNFYPEVAERTQHLTHGMIKLPGGVKMSSRKGNTLQASDILDAAREANKKVIGHDDEQTTLAAVKYAFLKQRIGGDIIYDPEESVSMEGNSGPYLQYAHARARSILQKVGEFTLADIEALEPGERSLVRKLSEYHEVVERASTELMPHHICTYLYELAQTFNRFYEKNRVKDDPRQATRATLVDLYAKTLKNGLELLNIHAPEKM